jgi:hypothetical protein
MALRRAAWSWWVCAWLVVGAGCGPSEADVSQDAGSPSQDSDDVGQDPGDVSQDTDDAGQDASQNADDAPDGLDGGVDEPRVRPSEEGGCNGLRALCGRRFDEVVYATTHNAMSSEENGFYGPNQRYAVPRQLLEGVRGLMLDLYEEDGELWLCHGVCLAGKQPLLEGLREIADFLDAHPREVVSLILESYITPARLEEAFEGSGLSRHAHAQPVGEAWPTLGQMIEAERRLVVFSDTEAPEHPWQHHLWAWTKETHYSFKREDEFSCAPHRGTEGATLFVLNHFLTNPIGRVDLAERANHNPLLEDRARACMAERGALPNFIAVDFYDIGDVFAVTDALNAGTVP